MSKQRTPGDCMRRAVHIAYGIPLAQLPTRLPSAENAHDDQFRLAWEVWAIRNGYALWYSESLAPVFAGRWIASVADRGCKAGSHAVVMDGSKLLVDPNEVSIRTAIDEIGLDPYGMIGKSWRDIEVHTDVSLDQVYAATVLIRMEHLDALNGNKHRMEPIGGPPNWMIEQYEGSKARDALNGSFESRVPVPNSGTLSMLEDFGATSGALTGDTATTGQTWASIGGSASATDFTETAAPDNAVIRTADNDNSTDLRRGRGVVLGTGTPTDVCVGVDCATATVVSAQGVIARFTDANNFVFGGLSWVLSPPNVRIGYYLVKVVAGTVSTVGYTSQTLADTSGTRRVELTVRDSGLITLAVDGIVRVSAQDAVFATGGALASGKSGILDWAISGGTGTRTYSDFRVSIPTSGQIAIHDGQSLDFRADGSVWREVAAGSIYTQPQTQTVAVPPKLGPYGDDGIANRLMVMAGRFNPDQASQPYFDPFTVKVYITPVYEVGATDD